MEWEDRICYCDKWGCRGLICYQGERRLQGWVCRLKMRLENEVDIQWRKILEDIKIDASLNHHFVNTFPADSVKIPREKCATTGFCSGDFKNVIIYIQVVQENCKWKLITIACKNQNVFPLKNWRHKQTFALFGSPWFAWGLVHFLFVLHVFSQSVLR